MWCCFIVGGLLAQRRVGTVYWRAGLMPSYCSKTRHWLLDQLKLQTSIFLCLTYFLQSKNFGRLHSKIFQCWFLTDDLTFFRTMPVRWTRTRILTTTRQLTINAIQLTRALSAGKILEYKTPEQTITSHETKLNSRQCCYENGCNHQWAPTTAADWAADFRPADSTTTATSGATSSGTYWIRRSTETSWNQHGVLITLWPEKRNAKSLKSSIIVDLLLINACI